MRYRTAKKLHSGDEVGIKRTGQTARVISVSVFPRLVFVELTLWKLGYIRLSHLEIE